MNLKKNIESSLHTGIPHDNLKHEQMTGNIAFIYHHQSIVTKM